MPPADPPAAADADTAVVKPDDSALSLTSPTKPKADAPKAAPEKQPVSIPALFRFATLADGLLFLLGAGSALATGSSMAAFTIILGNLFDALNSTDRSEAQRVSLLFVWIGIGLGAAGTLQFACFIMLSERLTIRLRKAYFRAVLEQDITFFDEQGASTLGSRVAEATLAFQDGIGDKFGQLFQFAAMFVAGLIVGFIYAWQIALLVFAITPFLGLGGYFMATTIGKILNGQLETYAKAGGIAEETFSLIRTVTSLGIQRRRIAKYEKELQLAVEDSKNIGTSMGFGFGSVLGLYFCSYSYTFYAGAVLINQSRQDQAAAHPLNNATALVFPFCAVGQVAPPLCTSPAGENITFATMGDVCACAYCGCGCFANGPTSKSLCLTGGDVTLAFFSTIIGAFGIGQAAPSVSALNKARIAVRDLYDVIDRKPRITDPADPKPLPANGDGSFTFQNVAFAYPSRADAPIFTDLNLTIPGGKRTAFCGQSGSGKSTALQLLMRFYDPAAGRVTFEGVDLRDLRIKELRKSIGLVSQEPILFATSIRENVAFGVPEATTLEQIERACRDANAHDFIATFPAGYDTFVGGSGGQLSGGQKQRIAIARALLRNPKVLLLDEATAALDNESERLVNEAIDKIMAQSSRTIVVIAHRLTSIRYCDKIVVFDRGRVLEEGNHDELMAIPNGMYASLVRISEGGGGDGKKTHKIKSPKTIAAGADPSSVAATAALSSGAAVALDPDEETGSSGSDSKAGGATPAGTRPSTPEGSESAVTSADAAAGGKKPKRKRVPIRRAFKFAAPEKLLFIPLIAACVGNGVSFPIFALLLSRLISAFFATNGSYLVDVARVWALGFLGLGIGVALCIFFMNYLSGIINGRMTARVRAAVFRALVRREMAYFDRKENSVGVLAAKLATDSAMVKAAISDRLEVGLQNVATLVAGFTIAFIASWKLSLVVLALFPVIALSGAAQFIVMGGMARNEKNKLAGAAQTLSESITGIRTVQAFQMRDVVVRLYDEQLVEPMRAATKKGFMGGFAFGLSQAMLFFAYAIAFWYGSQLVKDGEITFTDLNQALFGIMNSAMAVGQVSAMAPDIAKGGAAVEAVFEILDDESAIDPLDEDSGAKPSAVKGDITLDGVTFAYPTRKQVTVMDDVSFEFPRGKTIALVGQSGSGKSTIISLTQRFYDPDAGVVKLDGVPLTELNVGWLRDQIGIVSQEPVLFDDTIMENIRYGRPDATDEECIAAADQAAAKDFIEEFPLKFNTPCGLRGGALSGGQRQRVAIARALVKGERMKILLLDEATSALDENSQRSVQQTLDKLLEKSTRTTLVVAHRLSTVRGADCIVVMERGKVVEFGTFAELSTKPDGAFAKLLKAQEKHEG